MLDLIDLVYLIWYNDGNEDENHEFFLLGDWIGSVDLIELVTNEWI